MAKLTAATINETDDTDRGVYHDRCAEQNHDVHQLLLTSKSHTWERNEDPGTFNNLGKDLGDDMLVGATSSFARTGANMDAFANKFEQSIGSGRHNHQLGIIDEVEKPGSDISNVTESKANLTLRSAKASWKHPVESTPAASNDIQKVEELQVLQHLTAGSHFQVAGTSSSGSFTAALDNKMPAVYFCTTESKHQRPKFLGRRRHGFSNTARQTRLHDCHSMIYRLMPHSRTICFGMNTESFRREGFTYHVTASINAAIFEVVREFHLMKLGIAFAYKPGSSNNVFNIRYDPSLPDGTLAQAFFPSDPRKNWHLGISRCGALLSGGYLHYMSNILKHEFTHILGLRHWNAGLSMCELREPSVLWPGTLDGNRDSIMNTGVHPCQLCFSGEDIRVIREVYSAPNGAEVGGRSIFDVIP